MATDPDIYRHEDDEPTEETIYVDDITNKLKEFISDIVHAMDTQSLQTLPPMAEASFSKAVALLNIAHAELLTCTYHRCRGD